MAQGMSSPESQSMDSIMRRRDADPGMEGRGQDINEDGIWRRLAALEEIMETSFMNFTELEERLDSMLITDNEVAGEKLMTTDAKAAVVSPSRLSQRIDELTKRQRGLNGRIRNLTHRVDL